MCHLDEYFTLKYYTFWSSIVLGLLLKKLIRKVPSNCNNWRLHERVLSTALKIVKNIKT